MAKSNSYIVLIGLLFIRHAWGALQTPYITYRTLSKGENLLQIIPIFMLCLGYFGWASLAHYGISAQPFFLTVSFGKLVIGASVTFILILFSLWLIGLLFKGTGSLRTIILPWSYALLPTLLWFWATSMLSIIIPPPRTPSLPGLSLSFLFIVFSLFLFFWKGVLYYLTLRHGMKLGFWRIVGASCIIFPLGAMYAMLLYRTGIFRIPFI